MIIVKLSGGLGNQMFQYAFGIGLAQAKNVSVFFDTSWYKRNSDRNLEIENFVGKINEASNYQIANILYPKNKIMFLFSLFTHLTWSLSKVHFVEKKFFEFDSDLYNKISESCYLDGYWQNERYFINKREEILNKINLYRNTDKRIARYLNDIRNTNSISIHVRRGDYVKLKVDNICNLEYFHAALELMKNRIPDGKYFIFTDDTNWVNKNLKIEGSCIVSSPSELFPITDLLLMSQCKNNIIANSSYSWWGAWLNKNSVKVVIAPLKWNNDATKTSPALSEWIKINNT
ncbi:MAG: alpha-1,2-fucosyltransferase [Candidatus Pacebacteria bacterium]|nr:alpha-1,2-fucosyltransferase [Candidatus Paceibacterota bacterium]